jgi:DNA (cytosine-5)-methyltransferase 1
LRGYFTEGRTPWQAVTADAERCVGTADSERENTSLKIYAVDQGGGKSQANVSEELSPTLTCTHGGEPVVAFSFDALSSNSMKSSNPHSGCRQVEVAKCLDTSDPTPSKNQGGIAVVEPICFDAYNHDVTGRVAKTLTAMRADADHISVCFVPYTLKIRSGCEGGGKGALIQTDMSATIATNNDQYLFQPIFAMKCYDARGNGDGETVNTITGDHENRITDYTSVVVSEETIALEGNGSRPSHHGNGYAVSDKSYTLNTTEVHGVVYQQNIGALCARDYKGVGSQYVDEDKLIIEKTSAQDFAFPAEIHEFVKDNNSDAPRQQDLLQTADGVCRTLAPDTHAMGSHLTKTIIDMGTHYVVRRLTPTECARLQGFADRWGDIEPKTEFSDEEYKFWLEVRNTHATINGKAVKEYTKSQMLTWYNKLHTDSAEYKLWGNGIALPTALYVIQGIAEI